mmetsp:Transcript_53121/g.95652  ORF Transcript_53121/g.95652 Transcript_53121/m.95652 type:complete len:96 (+) Transcript_53121:371-658(+)
MRPRRISCMLFPMRPLPPLDTCMGEVSPNGGEVGLRVDFDESAPGEAEARIAAGEGSSALDGSEEGLEDTGGLGDSLMVKGKQGSALLQLAEQVI